MGDTVNLMDLFKTIKKRIALIIVMTLLGGMIAGIVSYFFITPIYQASTQLLVNKSKNEETLYNSNEIQTNLQLMNTYFVILESPRILNQVIDKLDLSMSSSELNEMITVESKENSQVLNITIKNEDPQMAVNLANTIANVFQNNISEIMNVDNVTILAEAIPGENSVPIEPQPILNILIGTAAGLVAGTGVVLLCEFTDNTIKTEQDIHKHFGVPVLGIIPQTGKIDS